MDVHVSLTGFGQGNSSTEYTYSLPEAATIADLMRLMGLEPHEAMLVFIGSNLAQAQTVLHHGAQVHFCAYICGG